jgi:hypothetical protein
LLATEQPWTFLDALAARCITPEEVLRAMKRDPIAQQTYSRSREKHPLRRQRNVEVVELEGEELDVFLSLVAQNSADALGDGGGGRHCRGASAPMRQWLLMTARPAGSSGNAILKPPF